MRKRGPSFLGHLLPILRLTFLESSCNFQQFGFKKMMGIFFDYTGLQDPCVKIELSKLNSTLGPVVPLAMFLSYMYFSSDYQYHISWS